MPPPQFAVDSPLKGWHPFTSATRSPLTESQLDFVIATIWEVKWWNDQHLRTKLRKELPVLTTKDHAGTFATPTEGNAYLQGANKLLLEQSSKATGGRDGVLISHLMQHHMAKYTFSVLRLHLQARPGGIRDWVCDIVLNGEGLQMCVVPHTMLLTDHLHVFYTFFF